MGPTFLTTGFLLLSNHADSAIEGETAGITKGEPQAFAIATAWLWKNSGLKNSDAPNAFEIRIVARRWARPCSRIAADQQRIVSEESSFLPDGLRGSDNDLIHRGRKRRRITSEHSLGMTPVLREGRDLLEPAPQRLGSAGRDHTFGHTASAIIKRCVTSLTVSKRTMEKAGQKDGKTRQDLWDPEKGCHPLTEYERNSPGEALPFRLPGQEPRLH